MPSEGYKLADFGDPEAELARLMRQAKVVQRAEHELLGELGFPREGLALDVGCGPGGFAAALAAERPELSLVGLDIERRSLVRSAQVMPAVLADARRPPFAEGAFDVAFARLALRYIRGPERAIASMARVVRPGGLVLVEDADHDALDVRPEIPGLRDILAARHASMERAGAEPGVVLRVAGMLEVAGLTDVTTRELTVTSAWIGVEAFAAIVLKPIAEAVDGDLANDGDLEALRAAIDDWSSLADASASTRVLFVAGRKPLAAMSA